MNALSIHEKLHGIDTRGLTPLQRILLITDGTLTEILEAYFLEPIRLIKLSQQIVRNHPSYRDIGDEIMERKILLRGQNSHINYVYAESGIALENLSQDFRDALTGSDIPLGRLWLEHRLETFKEMIDVRSEPAGERGAYFGGTAFMHLLARRYRVFVRQAPTMIITEWFPAVLPDY